MVLSPGRTRSELAHAQVEIAICDRTASKIAPGRIALKDAAGKAVRADKLAFCLAKPSEAVYFGPHGSKVLARDG